MSLASAQRIIALDWVSFYNQNLKPKPKPPPPLAAAAATAAATTTDCVLPDHQLRELLRAWRILPQR